MKLIKIGIFRGEGSQRISLLWEGGMDTSGTADLHVIVVSIVVSIPFHVVCRLSSSCQTLFLTLQVHIFHKFNINLTEYIHVMSTFCSASLPGYHYCNKL